MDLFGHFTAKGCCQDLPLEKGWSELDKAQPHQTCASFTFALYVRLTDCCSLMKTLLKLRRFLVVQLLIYGAMMMYLTLCCFQSL